jgi:hypothetical protein
LDGVTGDMAANESEYRAILWNAAIPAEKKIRD